MARELHLDERLSLLDSQPDVDVLYRDLDLYVHPSLSEGFSNSILEAMSHSLPVVPTAAGGNPEAVVEDVTGLLVPAGDPVALSEAIVTLVDDAPRRRRLGLAGFERVRQKFSVQAMVEGYESLYRQVVSPSVA
jgi:glycosyltransferase involved in cell wall biosynthesis